MKENEGGKESDNTMLAVWSHCFALPTVATCLELEAFTNLNIICIWWQRWELGCASMHINEKLP